jgi:hypothetical protein
MNPKEELYALISTCYVLLNQLEAKELDNKRAIASKDQLISVLRSDLDDVRCAYCSLLHTYSVTLGVKQTPEGIAESFGWGCFDKADR